MSCDLYMEHENRSAKDDIASAKGKFKRVCNFDWSPVREPNRPSGCTGRPGQAPEKEAWRATVSEVHKEVKRKKYVRVEVEQLILYTTCTSQWCGYPCQGLRWAWRRQVGGASSSRCGDDEGILVLKSLHSSLKQTTFDRTPWMRNLGAPDRSTRTGARKSGLAKTLKLLSGPGFNHSCGNTQKSLMTLLARPLPG